MQFISVRVFENIVPETNRHPTDHLVGLTFSFVTIYKESLDHLSYYQLLRRQCTMNASRHSLRHLTWMSHQAIHRGRKLISWVEPWCTDHQQTFVWFTSFVHCDLPSGDVFIVCNEMYGRSRWPRGLRRRSAAAWLLGSRARIPLGAWMFVCCVVLCR
jgi:hypothetical protein